MSVKWCCVAFIALAFAADISGARTASSITIPAHIPHPEDDLYHCVASKAPKDVSHVVHFEAKRANFVHGRVHHMILFGCKTPYQETGHWNCEEHPICGGGEDSFVVYAWAKKAPSMTMPEGAGFVVGGDTSLKYFVLQQHFLRKNPRGLPQPTGLNMVIQKGLPQQYAGMFLVEVNKFKIPPKKNHVAVSTHCKVDTTGKPFELFAYRTHAHDIGEMVHGTLNSKEIVRHSPQIPQAFNLLQSPIKVKSGDDMSVKCVYDSSKRNRETDVGPTHLDEMCNLYFMFLADEPELVSFTCAGSDGEETEFDKQVEKIKFDQKHDFFL